MVSRQALLHDSKATNQEEWLLSRKLSSSYDSERQYAGQTDELLHEDRGPRASLRIRDEFEEADGSTSTCMLSERALIPSRNIFYSADSPAELHWLMHI